MHSPFFTVITATYNAAAILPRLLESLAAQTFRDFEVIIQDGASSDATAAVAEPFRDRLPAFSLVSEPDIGIYDAWNKALERATGEWILFLGADDAFKDENTLKATKNLLQELSGTTLFACGNLEIITGAGRARETVVPRITGSRALLRQGIMPVGHPAVFYRRCIFHTHSFDTDFRIAGDYDFLCRTWIDDSLVADLCITVTRMGAGGISDSPFGALATRLEMLRSQQRHFPGERSFLQRILLYAKSSLLALVCACCGKKYAPTVLDKIRIMRGLPPVWKEKV